MFSHSENARKCLTGGRSPQGRNGEFAAGAGEFPDRNPFVDYGRKNLCQTSERCRQHQNERQVGDRDESGRGVGMVARTGRLRIGMRVGNRYPVDDVRMVKQRCACHIPDKKYEQSAGQQPFYFIRALFHDNSTVGKDRRKRQ